MIFRHRHRHNFLIFFFLCAHFPTFDSHPLQNQLEFFIFSSFSFPFAVAVCMCHLKIFCSIKFLLRVEAKTLALASRKKKWCEIERMWEGKTATEKWCKHEVAFHWIWYGVCVLTTSAPDYLLSFTVFLLSFFHSFPFIPLCDVGWIFCLIFSLWFP